MDIGSHHTHLIGVGDDIELTANEPFPDFDATLLKDAVDSSNKSNIAVVVVENDEIILFEITSRGLREGATWTMRGGGKRGDVRTRRAWRNPSRSKSQKRYLRQPLPNYQ